MAYFITHFLDLAIPQKLSNYGVALMNAKTYLNAFNQGLATTPEALTALKSSLSSLNATQVANILCTKELTEEQVKELLAATTLDDAEKEYIRTKYQVVAAEGADAAAKNASTFSWKAMTLAIWDNIKATVVWLATNPVGQLILIGGALAGLTALFKHLDKAVERHIETIQELEQEYSSNESTLQTLQDELATTNQRILELEGMDSLTLVEQGELKDLKQANIELTREIALLKQRNKELQEQRDKEAQEAWDDMHKNIFTTRKYYDDPEEDAHASDIEYAELLMRRIKEWRELRDEFYTEALLDGVISDNEQKALENYEKTLSDYEAELSKIRDLAVDIGHSEADAFADQIAAFLDPSYADEILATSVPAIVKNLKNSISSLSEEQSTFKIKLALDDQYAAEMTARTKALVDSLMADEEFSAWILSAQNMGKIAEQDTESIWGLVKSVYAISDALQDASESTDQFTALAEHLAQDTDVLWQAIMHLDADNASAIFEEDALNDLLDKFPNLIDELDAYASGLINDTQLQSAFNNAIDDFNTDAIYDGINNIVDATETYGASSNQVKQAVQNLDRIIPGFVDALYDQETGLLSVDAAALLSESSLYDMADAAIAAENAAANADFSHAIQELEALRDAAIEAAGAYYATRGAVNDELIDQVTDYQNQIDALYKEFNSGYLERLHSSVDEARNRYTRTSGSSDPWLEAFEAEYAAHKHAVNMERETLEDFYAWLANANERYFANSEKYLDEYRKYAEEVFNGLRELAEDAINDMEHHIFLMENQGGQEDKIIAVYRQIQNEAHAAAEAYRKTQLALGRSLASINNDDFIQEQQKIWWDAENAIKDLVETINDDLHDSLESLLDVTIEMIEKGYEEEIEALEDISDEYEKIINQRKEMLQLAERERQYNEEVEEKTSELAKLQARAASLKQAADTGDRQAELELGSVLEEISELQKDLNNTQREHFIETTEDALDNELEQFEDQQEKKIEAIEDYLDDQQALTAEALAKLDSMNEDLFEQLWEYVSKYTDMSRKEFEDMWNAALEAAKKYGSFTAALNASAAGTIGSTSSMTTAQKVAQMKEYSAAWNSTTDPNLREAYANEALKLGNSIAGATRDNNGVWWLDGKKLYEMSDAELAMYDNMSGSSSSSTDVDSIVSALVKQMKSNAASWSTASNPQALVDQNNQIATQVASLLGRKVVRGDDGVWYLDRVGGQRLFDVYHSGGIVGGKGTLAQNELFALLEKREIVLNEAQQGNLMAMLSQLKPLNALKDFFGLLSGVKHGSTSSNPIIQVDASVHMEGGTTDKEILSILKKHPRDVANIVAKQIKNL